MASPKNHRRLVAGFWTDEAGDLHVSLPELLAALAAVEETEAAQTGPRVHAIVKLAQVLEVSVSELFGVIRQELARVIPRTEIVERDACPHCGLTGLGPHGPSCPYAGAVPGAEP